LATGWGWNLKIGHLCHLWSSWSSLVIFGYLARRRLTGHKLKSSNRQYLYITIKIDGARPFPARAENGVPNRQNAPKTANQWTG